MGSAEGKHLRQAAGLVAGLGCATIAGALIEARAYRLVHHHLSLPQTKGDGANWRILHLSDTHYQRGQLAKARFLASLSATKPDLVVMTGDIISDDDGLDEFLDSLGPLLACPGVFVRGSNDYFAPTPVNPFAYLGLASTKPSHERTALHWRRLRDALRQAGWHDLDNARVQLRLGGQLVELRGTEDAHIGLDDYVAAFAVPFDDMPTPDLVLGVTHAPYRRVLAAMSTGGAALVLAGHTHGGQIGLPGRAIISNCDLPPTLARGLHRWPSPPSAGQASTWLHVSAGVGTSPHFPLRLFCRPEACIIDIDACPPSG